MGEKLLIVIETDATMGTVAISDNFFKSRFRLMSPDVDLPENFQIYVVTFVRTTVCKNVKNVHFDTNKIQTKELTLCL